MVDTLVLGTSAERREGSSPFIRTKARIPASGWVFALWGVGRESERSEATGSSPF